MSSGGTVIDISYAEMRADMVKLEADLKEMRRKVAAAAAQASQSKVKIGVEAGGGGLQGSIERMNKMFGEDSAMGKLLAAGRGGAFVAALEGAGQALQKVGGKMAELNKEYAAGTIGIGGWITKLGMSTPVIGTLAEGIKSASEGMWDWVALVSTATWKNRELADSYLSISAQSAKLKERTDKNFAVKMKSFADRKAGDEATDALNKELRVNGMSEADKERQKAADERAARDKEIRERFRTSTAANRDDQLKEQLAVSRKIFDQEMKRIDEAPYLEAVKNKAQGVVDALKSLKDSAREKSMSERDRVMEDLKNLGARKDQLADADMWLRVKEAAEAKKKAEEEEKKAAKEAADEKKKAQEEEKKRLDDLAARGKAMYEKHRSAAEIYRDELLEITELVKAQVLDPEMGRAAIQKAMDEYKKSKPQTKVEFGDLSSFVQSMNARIANSRTESAADRKAREDQQLKAQEAAAGAMAQAAETMKEFTAEYKKQKAMTVTFEKR